MYWSWSYKHYIPLTAFFFAVKYFGLNVLRFYIICIRISVLRHRAIWCEQIRYMRARTHAYSSFKHICVLIIVIITKLIVVYSYCRKSYPPMFLTMSTIRENPFSFSISTTRRKESGEILPKHTHTHTHIQPNVTFSLPFVIINFYVRHIRRYICPSIRW